MCEPQNVPILYLRRFDEDAEKSALMGDGWTSTEGEFINVMAIATPCRSDMTKKGG